MLACALAVFLFLAAVNPAAAKRAAELGPEVPLREPSGGYVGQLKVAPPRGPAGTPIAVTRRGIPGRAGIRAGLAHRERRVEGCERRVSTGASTRRRLPDRHGEERLLGPHRAWLRRAGRFRLLARRRAAASAGRLLTQTAFHLDMAAKLAGAAGGPAGSPIAIEVQGIGWRELEGSWVVLYDNKFTGFISAVTTGGTARFTIPATGTPAGTSWRSSIRISARRTAIPSSRRCRTGRLSGSATRSRRARRCCPRRRRAGAEGGPLASAAGRPGGGHRFFRDRATRGGEGLGLRGGKDLPASTGARSSATA